MKSSWNPIKLAVRAGILSLVAMVIPVNSAIPRLVAEPAGNAAAAPPDASSLSADVLIKPEDLVEILQSPKGDKPLLIHVGFHFLYTQGHIPGSEYIGPAAQPEMLEKLRKRVESLPRGKFIVLYCGCCPWTQCPTVKPAYEALHGMGFTSLKVLYIADNFGRNWVYKGFPTEKGP